MKKQTAVEWLYDQLTSTWFDKVSGTDVLKKAKEMEKEQQKQMLINLLDWMNKVAQDNAMVFETDIEDIVEMYLQA
jgi:hypothetical protein